ncbi:MAG: UPF0147 family protein [archaeon]
MELGEVIDTLTELYEDPSLPKNTKKKIEEMISNLKNDTDVSLKINKCQDVLEEISNDINLPTFIRTQIWGIASMLENLQ